MNPIHFNWASISCAEIDEQTQSTIKRSKMIYNQIEKLDFSDHSQRHNFMKLLVDNITEYNNFHSNIGLLQYISPNKRIREISRRADLLMERFNVYIGSRKPLYLKIKEYYHLVGNNMEEQEELFLQKLLKSYERMGINLDNKKSDILKRTKDKILSIEQECLDDIEKSFNTAQIVVEKKRLKGLPSSIISKLPQDQSHPNKCIIKLNPSLYELCMKNIIDPDVRQNIEYEYNSRCINNSRKFLHLILLRNDQAKILGYKNYSHFRCDGTMASSPASVKEFLLKMITMLDDRYFYDVQKMIKMKKAEYKKKIIEDFDEQINSWDLMYYIEQMKKYTFNIDEDELREFFPMDRTIDRILSIYQDIFKIKIELFSNKNVWHPSVKTYRIVDVDNQSTIGYFYLDLKARDGKLIEKCRCFHLKSATIYPFSTNKYQKPTSALVGSLYNKLLSHSEVVSIFHEFCHIIHHTFGKSKYPLLSGVNVETDFIKTPPQLMENWCWTVSGLKALSGHHITDNTIPTDIITKLIESRKICTGIQYKKNIMMAIYDQVIHSKDKFMKLCLDNLKETDSNIEIKLSYFFKKFFEEIMSTDDKHQKYSYTIAFNIGTFMPISWQNLFNECAGINYSFLWSEVNSCDLFYEKYIESDRGNEKYPKIKDSGLEFRRKILQFGGTKKGRTMLNDMLGRRPSNLNFFKLKNIKPKIKNERDSGIFCRYLTTSGDSRFKNNGQERCDISSSDSSSSSYDDECLEQSDSINDSYITENTESLAKYSNIFLPETI